MTLAPWYPDAERFDARAVSAYVKTRYLDRLAYLIGQGVDVSDARRFLTKDDPFLFALAYLRHHLRDDATGGAITFSDAHLDWVEHAREWTTPTTEPEESRHAFIAPRNTGKSTWWFLILPLWAAAHGHIKFVAAFADSASQAELHLATFKRELETNSDLRADFPELTNPLVRGRGVLASDNRNLYLAASGFAFMAKGIDSGALGTKVGAQRPDLILLDDVEPGESQYSLDQMKKRLATITDVVLPLSTMARVVLVGTVTMPGSIVHQLVKSTRSLDDLSAEELEALAWIERERIVAHHYRPILPTNEGGERSLWPGKWSMDYLNRLRGSRSFAKNFDNDPMGADGDYWTSDSFTRGTVAGITRTMLSIDPAVTTKASSDFTGIAVIGYSPSEKKCLVKKATAVKLGPAFLRKYVLKVLEDFPEIGLVLIETNQGGDVWKESILHDLPVRVRTVHQHAKKEVRAANVLTDYERGRVVHVPNLNAVEEQMVAFPGGPNDDIVDAVVSGVARFLHPRKKKGMGATSASYI